MNLTLDTRDMNRLDTLLATAGRYFTSQVAGQILAEAAKPMLIRVRNDTRVRSGATRRDARIRTVAGVNGEVTRVLVGISKRRGKSGFRTRFQVKGTRYQRANDFLSQAEAETAFLVRDRFFMVAESRVARLLKRNRL